MNVKNTQYKGKTIRYLVLPDNGLLLNTTDVLGIMGIGVRPQGSDLAQPCLDLASAITVAGSNNDFATWLIETFENYSSETPVIPRCDDDWNFD